MTDARMKKLISFRTFKKYCVMINIQNSPKLYCDEAKTLCICNSKNCPVWNRLKEAVECIDGLLGVIDAIRGDGAIYSFALVKAKQILEENK